ncbi:MAG: hypothetical protein LIO93_02205, partial [Bacteroidales bacterium]|nr:hypothetical protein [Bacteroidales bacterium]
LLPYTGREQDGDLEMADSKRIDEFLSYYTKEKENLFGEEKTALMALILASYEDYLNENGLTQDKRWERIENLLISENDLFLELLDYWNLAEQKESDSFAITPLVRSIKFFI